MDIIMGIPQSFTNNYSQERQNWLVLFSKLRLFSSTINGMEMFDKITALKLSEQENNFVKVYFWIHYSL